MLMISHFVDQNVAPYATETEFCKIFTDEMSSLYLLSLLLTGDNDKAELCFLRALEECVDESGVLRESTRSWARRMIIRHAIRLLVPMPGCTNSFSFSLKGIAKPGQNNHFGAIRALGVFERFVYVMTILEGWPEQECALRLRCARHDVMMARVLALNCIASVDAGLAVS